MANATVESVLNRIDAVLMDPDRVRWPESELVTWINDAQRDIVVKRPAANVAKTTVDVSAESSAYEFSLPEGGIALVDVTTVEGYPIPRGNADLIQVLASTYDQAATPDIYYVDNRDPKRYRVYPSLDGTVDFDIYYSAIPATVDEPDDNITLTDEYITAIADYVLHRAYAKDAEDSSAHSSMSQYYYTKFLTDLGLGYQARAAQQSEGTA